MTYSVDAFTINPMKMPLRYLTMATVLPVLAPAQSLVMVLLEEFHVQTSASTTALQEANFWAEVSDVAGVTGATVSASSGVLYGAGPQSLSPEGGNFEYKASYPEVAQLLTAYPSNGVYTMALTTGSGHFATHVPGAMTGTYGEHQPTSPLFTISGVSGTWYTPASGPTQFRYNPTSGLSFTVTLNDYAVTTSGGHYAYHMKARDALSGDELNDGVGSDGPLADTVAFTAPAFTFTYGLATNTPTTYGFVEGSVLGIEAAFYNFLGLGPAGLPTAWGEPYNEVVQGFGFANETQLILVAVPEAAALPLWLALVALGAVATRRRR